MRILLELVGLALVVAGMSVVGGPRTPGTIAWAILLLAVGVAMMAVGLELYHRNEAALRDELRRVALSVQSPVERLADQAPTAPLAGQGDRLERAQTTGRYVARGVKWLTQADYAALLDGDRVQWARFDLEGEAPRHCRACHFGALMIEVAHPIWDGPLDGAGTGVVDVRRLPWCLRCEGRLDEKRLGAVGEQIDRASVPGPLLELAGLPIRLPWLDNLPVRLVPQLFERPAFHRLMVGVERWTPPALPPIGPDAPSGQYPAPPAPVDDGSTGDQQAELEERKCPHGVVHRDPFKRDGEKSAHCRVCVEG